MYIHMLREKAILTTSKRWFGDVTIFPSLFAAESVSRTLTVFWSGNTVFRWSCIQLRHRNGTSTRNPAPGQARGMLVTDANEQNVGLGRRTKARVGEREAVRKYDESRSQGEEAFSELRATSEETAERRRNGRKKRKQLLATWFAGNSFLSSLIFFILTTTLHDRAYKRAIWYARAQFHVYVDGNTRACIHASHTNETHTHLYC